MNFDNDSENKRSELVRVQYERRTITGITLKAEVIFFDDDSFRFQQTDGWELSPWEFVPDDSEIRFAQRLATRLHMVEKANRLRRELDEELAFQLLTTPEVCQESFELIASLARTAAVEYRRTGNLISHLEELSELESRGRVLVQRFLDVKREIQQWSSFVEKFDAASRTYDERNASDALTADYASS